MSKATEAKEKTDKAQDLEKIQFAAMSAIAQGFGEIKTTSSLEEELNNQIDGEYNIFPNSEKNNDAKKWKVVLNERVYEITSDGKVDPYESEGEFYIYHTGAEGGNIETVNMKDLTDETYDSTKNLTSETLYGGYYLDCGNKDTGEIYDGTNAIFSDPELESGMALHPKPNRTYYIKEVPSIYLRPRSLFFYSYSNKLIMIAHYSVIDDKNYSDVGLIISNKYITSSENINKKVDVNGTIQTANSLTGGEYKDGLISHYIFFDNRDMEYSSIIGMKIMKSYWVTPDDLTVTGVRQRAVVIKDLNENGVIDYGPEYMEEAKYVEAKIISRIIQR